MSVREEARVQPARDERAIALYVWDADRHGGVGGVHRGGQGTLSAGATGLLLGLMLLTASDRRILFRG